MVDPIFKAPLPPVNSPNVQAGIIRESGAQGSENTSSSDNNDSISTDENKSPSQKQKILIQLNGLKDHMIGYFWYSMIGLFLLGAFFGCAISSSNPAPQKVQSVTGISQKVITNGDKKGRLGICGSVSATQSCLFYILNNAGRDRLAKDFFEDVSRRTQRSVFNIKMDNPLYSDTLIKPGYFAEIIVPASN